MIASFRQPGGNSDPHHTGSTAVWHALLGVVPGALLASVGPGLSLAAAVLVGAAYWIAKERGDLRRGGGWRDGLEDAAAVSAGAGAGYVWPDALAAVMVMHLVGLIAMAGHIWRGRG